MLVCWKAQMAIVALVQYCTVTDGPAAMALRGVQKRVDVASFQMCSQHLSLSPALAVAAYRTY